MHGLGHSTVREGLLTGLMGAVLMAAWYFGGDVASARPFYTPNMLGQIIFRGDLTPGFTGLCPR